MRKYTKQDKIDLINELKSIDVKELEINHENEHYKKWYRFGSFNTLQMVAEIIKGLPEKEQGVVS